MFDVVFTDHRIKLSCVLIWQEIISIALINIEIKYNKKVKR